MVRFVLVTPRDGDFDGFEVSKKSYFLELVPQKSNCVFYVSYADSSLSCKFELNTAVLDFYRFEVTKNPNFSQLVP